MYETAKETQMYRTVLWTLWERERVGRFGRMALKHVRLYFFGSKINADSDCSHEIKRHLLLGRKVMTNLDSILKSRDITLPTKVRLVKAMVFPVVTQIKTEGRRRRGRQRMR